MGMGKTAKAFPSEYQGLAEEFIDKMPRKRFRLVITAVEIVRALTKCRELLNCDVNDRDISGRDLLRPSFLLR